MTDQLLKKRTEAPRSKVAKPRYLLLWERIQQLELKLRNQESINETIIREFSKKVLPLEEQVTLEIIELTKDIMRLFHSSEDNANRSLLGFWVLDNFKLLAAHPFANESDVQELYDEWRLPIQGTDDMIEAQLSLLMASRDDLPGQSKVRSNYPDADMFAAKKEPPKRPASAVFEDSEDFSVGTEQSQHNDSEFDPSSSAHESDHRAEKKTNRAQSKKKSAKTSTVGKEKLDNLFDIDKLFRRIAKAVHPDREQDEDKKAQKHAIMSDCLNARNNGDIASLLALYAEHVGDLPTNWSDERSGELVHALETQLLELENRAAKLHSHDPLLQLILNRYLAYDTQDVARRINIHKEKISEKLQGLQQQRENLKTDEGFLDALAERRDIELDRLTLSNLTS